MCSCSNSIASIFVDLLNKKLYNKSKDCDWSTTNQTNGVWASCKRSFYLSSADCWTRERITVSWYVYSISLTASYSDSHRMTWWSVNKLPFACCSSVMSGLIEMYSVTASRQGRRGILWWECLSVCFLASPHAYTCISRTTCPNFTRVSVGVAYCCGSVFLWQRCNTLCTSGFVDDVFQWQSDVTAAASLQSPVRCKTLTPGYWFCCFLTTVGTKISGVVLQMPGARAPKILELHHFLGQVLYLTRAFFGVVSPNCILPHLNNTCFLSALFCVQFLLLAVFVVTPGPQIYF